MIKDCLNRKAFKTLNDALRYRQWTGERLEIHFTNPFLCNRCGHYHLAATPEDASKAQKFLKRERCITNRDLHLQMSRVIRVSLDELQTLVNLAEISIGKGPSIITIPRKKT